MKSYTLRPDTFTLNFNLLFQVPAYPDMMFSFGLCSEKQKVVITDYCDRPVAFFKSGNMTAAFTFGTKCSMVTFPYPNYFHK
jgi:hypothetical protein